MNDTNLAHLPKPVVDSALMAAHAGRETIAGWRAIVQSGDTCHEGCLAPGSSPHSHVTVTGYEVMTTSPEGNGSVFRFDAEGTAWAHGTLHRFPEETS